MEIYDFSLVTWWIDKLHVQYVHTICYLKLLWLHGWNSSCTREIAFLIPDVDITWVIVLGLRTSLVRKTSSYD